MGRLARSLNSVMLIGGVSAIAWNLLLDERAKQSVRDAADQVVNLGMTTPRSGSYFFAAGFDSKAQIFVKEFILIRK